MNKYLNDPSAWFQLALDAHRAAKLLFQQDALLWFSGALLGHRALEMFLKAALVRQGRRISPSDVWGHDLVALCDELPAGAAEGFPKEFAATLATFNDYFDELRYPQPVSDHVKLRDETSDRLEEAVRCLIPHAKGQVARE